MKVTKADIEKRIKSVRFVHIPGTTHTVCHIDLDNGYGEIGESACVDPTQFSAEIGRTSAYDDAFRKLYKPLAFLLLEAKFQQATTHTFGNALKALKEGKRIKRVNAPDEIRLTSGSFYRDYIGGTKEIEVFSAAGVLAEDWIVL